MRRTPQIAGGDIMVTITDLARMWNVPRPTARDRINGLVRADESIGIKVDWVDSGRGCRGSKKRYNLSRLERAHPSMFRKHYVSAEDFTDLVERVDNVEKIQKSEKQKFNAHLSFHRSQKVA